MGTLDTRLWDLGIEFQISSLVWPRLGGIHVGLAIQHFLLLQGLGFRIQGFSPAAKSRIMSVNSFSYHSPPLLDAPPDLALVLPLDS